MLSVRELLPYYPESLHPFREFILREYLQHKILQIVFGVPEYGRMLCFLGGTCLRIVHGNARFSEDLDFDNFGLTDDDFHTIAGIIEKELEREGYQVEIRTVIRGAFHCHIRFPGLLYQEGLTGHQDQKILIQLDTEPQHYGFTPEKFILNRFDVFTEIPVSPIDLLLAQKFYALINRKRSKGRDFFDVIFLLSRNAKPDYNYLNLKLNISGPEALRERVLETCAQVDLNEMAKEVEPFLFNSADTKKIRLFEAYMKQVKLD